MCDLVQVEKAALTEKLVNLRQKWPVDTLTYNEQMLRNNLGDDLEKVDEAAKLLNAIQVCTFDPIIMSENDAAYSC